MPEIYFLAEKTHKREGAVQLSGSTVETDDVAESNQLKRKAKKN
jgi:hypothetical protein